jgi:hypothetical protein
LYGSNNRHKPQESIVQSIRKKRKNIIIQAPLHKTNIVKKNIGGAFGVDLPHEISFSEQVLEGGGKM